MLCVVIPLSTRVQTLIVYRLTRFMSIDSNEGNTEERFSCSRYHPSVQSTFVLITVCAPPHCSSAGWRANLNNVSLDNINFATAQIFSQSSYQPNHDQQGWQFRNSQKGHNVWKRCDKEDWSCGGGRRVYVVDSSGVAVQPLHYRPPGAAGAD